MGWDVESKKNRWSVSSGEPVEQRRAKVEVGAVRLVRELAQLGVAVALDRGHRVDRRLGRAPRLALLLSRGEPAST
jgi:hypothetical protein